MPDLYLLLNHRLTDLQREDARRSLGISRFVELPPDLKGLWQQIPPELPSIRGYLAPIRDWLEAHASPSDYVLIQGDFGACFIMVGFAFGKGLIPIYSTTHREAVEIHKEDGSVELTHQFRHRIFRRYGA